MYGFGSAWTMVYALQHAGKTPTRAGLIKALKSLNTGGNPFVYPGIRLQTSARDNFPIEQEIMIKWAGGAIRGLAALREAPQQRSLEQRDSSFGRGGFGPLCRSVA